jgi:predicted RND superfamily exporter protein
MKSVTYEDLSKIKYNDLKAKFTELGIEEAFQGGAKKEDLIQSALSKLEMVKELKDQGIPDKDIKKEIQKTEEEMEADRKSKLLKDTKEALETQKQEGDALRDSIVGLKLTPQQIDSNIKGINANLKNMPKEAARLILLKKLVILESLK